jgi:thioredoxin reductase
MNSEAASRTWDCIVVGAGPAGLNAALVLGRARRRVLVLDSAQPRNYATHEMHGVLGHDGLDPADLRARGRAELARYGVEVVTAEVEEAKTLDGAARLRSARGADLARTVLLATGMLDEVPDIPGFADVWGTSAHTCPYCDGFEHRDERLAVLAAGARGEHLARPAAPVVRRRRPAHRRPTRPRRRPARPRGRPRHSHHRDGRRRPGQRRDRASASHLS